MRKIELFIIYFPENVLREGVLDRKFFKNKGKYEVKIFEGIVEGQPILMNIDLSL